MSADRIIIRGQGRRTAEPAPRAEEAPTPRAEAVPPRRAEPVDAARARAAENRRILAERKPLEYSPLPDEPRLERRAPGIVDGRSGRLKRNLLVAGLAAAVLGVTAGLLLAPDWSDRRETRTAAAAPAEPPSAPPEARPELAAASGPYQAPQPDSVGRALQRVRADYAAGGASAVALASQGCFEQLRTSPSYAGLDYCLAYDQFGEALMRRLSGGSTPASDSWFGRTEARGREAAQAVMGDQGDANARVLDVRRLSVAAAEQRTTAQTETAENASVPASTESSASVAAPAPVEVARAEPTPVRERVEVARSSQTSAAPTPARPRPPTAETPPVARASAQEPTATARPSFNCRYARSASERMVCSDPVLAAADWRLHNAFEQARAQADDPRALRAEQDRWLQAREAAAPDPVEVLETYEARIDELTSRY